MSATHSGDSPLPGAPEWLRDELPAIRRLLGDGELRAAGDRLHRLMDLCGATPSTDSTLLFAEYLLQHGRAFSAEQVLGCLLTRTQSNRALLLHAQAALEQGDLPEAQRRAGRASTTASGPIDLGLVSAMDPDAARDNRARSAQRLQAELTQRHYLDPSDPLTTESLLAVDSRLGELVRTGRPEADGPAELWAYYLGEYLCRHVAARWVWRRQLSHSTLVLRSGLEINPYVWILWRMNHAEHHLRRFLAALLELEDVPPDRIAGLLGPDAMMSAHDQYVPQWGRHALSEALHYALTVHRDDAVVTSLGVLADASFCTVQVPLIVAGPNGPEAVLFWNTAEEEEAFRRYLDIVALSHIGRLRWRIVGHQDPTPADVRLYEKPDGAVRATLVSRRLVSSDPQANARWFRELCSVLLDGKLDGGPESVAWIDRHLIEVLRSGGPNRWGKLFDDRHALLFMITSYVGEVMRNQFGGNWGADRVTGEAIGPTSGLEVGNVRFNLGARVLKRFYKGISSSLSPVVEEYGRKSRA